MTDADEKAGNQELQRSLGAFMLWGLGVGYVISGMYFGWNLGLPKGGTLGLAISTFFIAIMYLAFTLSYAELTCAIPKAGGVFSYASRALGDRFGFIAGMAQIIEFVFAPPAIAAAIGAYLNIFFPMLSPIVFASCAYLLFTLINCWGVKVAAVFELCITVIAVIELLIFSGLTLPHFSWQAFTTNPLPQGLGGIFASIPFAIWFFLAIEGMANVAEETVNPQKNIVRGFGSAMITLLALCVLTFLSAVGVGGWEKVVFENGVPSDSPLPLALAQVIGTDSYFYHLLIAIGIFGLIASFHGIILVAGRVSFEFGRVGFAPSFIGRINRRTKTPIAALLINMVIGFAALASGKTSEIITLACFGALSLYVMAMISLFRLRKKEPLMPRPYRTPFYPMVPIVALTYPLWPYAP
tara:strand:- start:211 stop:1443 length:1233 start_codon:yes stop_codon:yes gene_type:complete